MTSTTRELPPRLGIVGRLVAVYVALVVATMAAMATLAAVDPAQATDDAWVHAGIVAVFALVLPLRLRSARRGSPRAYRAVGIVAAVLLVVNVVEALVPGLFPEWMRIEMIGIAIVMALIVRQVVQPRR